MGSWEGLWIGKGGRGDKGFRGNGDVPKGERKSCRRGRRRSQELSEEWELDWPWVIDSTQDQKSHLNRFFPGTSWVPLGTPTSSLASLPFCRRGRRRSQELSKNWDWPWGIDSTQDRKPSPRLSSPGIPWDRQRPRWLALLLADGDVGDPRNKASIGIGLGSLTPTRIANRLSGCPRQGSPGNANVLVGLASLPFPFGDEDVGVSRNKAQGGLGPGQAICTVRGHPTGPIKRKWRRPVCPCHPRSRKTVVFRSQMRFLD